MCCNRMCLHKDKMRMHMNFVRTCYDYVWIYDNNARLYSNVM